MHFPDKTKPWVCTDRSSDKGLLELDPVNWCTPYSDWASTKMISLRRAYTEGGTHRCGQCWRVELWQKIVRFKSGHCLWCFFTGCLDFSSSFFLPYIWAHSDCEYIDLCSLSVGQCGTLLYTELRGRDQSYHFMNTSFCVGANISSSWFPLPLSQQSLTPQLCHFRAACETNHRPHPG